MKNRPEGEAKSELLSLASILSIVLALAAICLVCLIALNRMGVYDTPWFLSKSKHTDGISLIPSGNSSEPLFDIDGAEIHYDSAQANEQTLKGLIFSMSERSTFSLRASITYIQSSDSETSLFFESAKDGDKYLIIIGDLLTGETKVSVGCDGTTGFFTENGVTESFSCNGESCWDQYSLMPDFPLLIGEDCGIIYTGADNDSYEIIFDSGSDGTVTDVKVSLSSGFLMYVKSYKNGRPIYSFEALGYSESYDESVFSTN